MKPRRPGRPAGGDPEATRRRLITVARTQFAAAGYAGASLRSIAREAAVDPSLIRHYFTDKAGLLVATMELPVNPAVVIAAAVEQGVDGLGERLVRAFLTSWDPHRDVFSTIIRTAVGDSDPLQTPAIQMAQHVLIGSLLTVLDGPDRDVRAELVAAQIIGMATLRYVVSLAPLASAPIDHVVDIYGPAIDRVVSG